MLVLHGITFLLYLNKLWNNIYNYLRTKLLCIIQTISVMSMRQNPMRNLGKQGNYWQCHKLKFVMSGPTISKNKWKKYYTFYPSLTSLPWFLIPLIKDTEFPGILVSRSEMEQRYYSEEDCEYIMIKRNV